jgi:peptide/nickel transport system substrate-binding protein
VNFDLRSGRASAACALALVMGVLVAACGGHKAHSSTSTATTPSSPGIAYGSLPPVGTPTPGQTISFGQLAGQTPRFIFPIVPGAAATAYTFDLIQNLFLPLYHIPDGASPTIDPSLSLAQRPTFSDHDRTVTIALKPGFRWSDGHPVDAADVAFEIELLKAAVDENAANWNQYTPGQFPTDVKSVATPSRYQLVIKLARAYNPGYFLNNELVLFPLPSTAWNIDRPGGPSLDAAKPADAKRIYDFLAAQGRHLATFASNPLWRVIDGPFRLHSFNPEDGSYTLSPNPDYHGVSPARATIDVKTFSSAATQLQALQGGDLDVGALDFSQLRDVPGLRSRGLAVFGGPSFGWVGATINFKDQTGHFAQIIRQPYVRQALTRLIDQEAYVKFIFKNAGSVNHGPVPNVPANPYTPANNASVDGPYPFSPAQAVSLLSAHGWKVVPNGQTTCQQPGAGPDQCGAGIPKGTPLRFNWIDLPASESPFSGPEAETFASLAKSRAGIGVQVQTKSFDYQLANYDDADPSAAANENAWAISDNGGFFYDFYPTSAEVFDTGGVFNAGGFSDHRADHLIDQSVRGPDPKAVTQEGSYLTETLPVLFLPQPDTLYAVARRIGGATKGFAALTQGSFSPQFWYVAK